MFSVADVEDVKRDKLTAALGTTETYTLGSVPVGQVLPRAIVDNGPSEYRLTPLIGKHGDNKAVHSGFRERVPAEDWAVSSVNTHVLDNPLALRELLRRGVFPVRPIPRWMRNKS